MFFEQHDRCGRSLLPLRGEIAVPSGELVQSRLCSIRQVRLYFVLPEIEAFTGRNPSRCNSNIGNHKLNGAQGEEHPDVIEGERFSSCFGREPVISPQFP